MKIILVASSFSGLCQRVLRELILDGHSVEQHYGMRVDELKQQLIDFQPDVIICPFLTHRIPTEIWQEYPCLIVHPGIEGDRGPSSIDWAIRDNWQYWGVTLLQADEEMDAGDIWGTAEFPLRCASKTSVYKREVSTCAVQLIKQALVDLKNPSFKPKPLNYADPAVVGQCRDLMRQPQREIDWQQSTTDEVIRSICAADTTPGVLDSILGHPVRLYGAIAEPVLTGSPGTLLAIKYGSVCRATTDGAVWIRQMKIQDHDTLPAIKLPAETVVTALADETYITQLKSIAAGEAANDIRVELDQDSAYIYFDFYNGAASTAQCRRLQQTIAEVKQQPIKTIVLMGGDDFFSNGIHLNCIEGAPNAGDESWANINAIDDVVLEIINTPNQVTIAALRNNAGAGGAIMALACDRVIVRDGVVLNPHYDKMGLYGSEYWTYLLPKKVGKANAETLVKQCQPMLAREAMDTGFADTLFPEDWQSYHQQLRELTKRVNDDPSFDELLTLKQSERAKDEAAKPLSSYREAELKQMKKAFFDADSRYHFERQLFVYKGKVPEKAAPEAVAS